MKPRLQVCPGQRMTVQYDRKRCIHSEECVRGLPAVFSAARDPWITPDAASADQLAAVIHRCPTGALHYQRHDGGPAEPPAEHNIATIALDGPLYLRGDLAVMLATGELRETRAALCRCGASRYKPFCDGSHTPTGFRDPGEPAATAIGEDSGHGPLAVNPAPDGPLLVTGPLEIRNARGTPVVRGREFALCRCGASGNKPFCDGSHKRIGFRSE